MNKTQSTGLSGYAYAMLGAVLFATKGIFIKLAYAEGVDTATLLTLRMAFALPFFMGTAIWIWIQRPPEARPAGRLLAGGIAAGMLGYYLSSWLDFEGLSHISAQLERLILFTYPFFTIVFAALLFRQPVKLPAIVGATVSYAGLILVMTGASAENHGNVLVGGSYVLAAAIVFGLYQVLAREFIVRMGSDFYTGLAMSAAAIAIFIHFFATGHNVANLLVSTKVYILSIGLAIFATVLPAYAMAAGLARIGAQGTAIIGTLSPLVTTILAVSLLGESFSWQDAMGTALVVGGVGLYTLIDSRRRAQAARP